MIRGANLLLCLALLAACSEHVPPLRVSDIIITAPLPGRSNSVAYMRVLNQSSKPVLLQRFSSPQFAVVEMHETLLNDGIASMRRLDSLTIAVGSTAEFASGGKHLMLLEPAQGLIPGQSVTIEINFDGDQVLPIEARLRSRQPGATQTR